MADTLYYSGYYAGYPYYGGYPYGHSYNPYGYNNYYSPARRTPTATSIPIGITIQS